MDNSQHTPGPWLAFGLGGPWERHLKVRAENWGVVAHIGVDPGLPHWDGPQRANARLIAAAPELLSVLQAYMAFDSTGTIEECRAITARAHAVLAAATGSTHE